MHNRYMCPILMTTCLEEYVKALEIQHMPPPRTHVLHDPVDPVVGEKHFSGHLLHIFFFSPGKPSPLNTSQTQSACPGLGGMNNY